MLRPVLAAVSLVELELLLRPVRPLRLAFLLRLAFPVAASALLAFSLAAVPGVFFVRP